MYHIFKINSSTIFNNKIAEAITNLDPKQKKEVSMYPETAPEVVARHDKVFGKVNDRIIIPLDRSDETPVRGLSFWSYRRPEMDKGVGTKVEKALHEHGYTIHDWVKGHAVKIDEPNLENPRKYSIGKLMGKLESNGSPISNIPSGIKTTGGRINGGQTKEMPLIDAFNSDPMRMSSKGDHVMVVSRNRCDVAGMSTGQGWTSCLNMDNGSNKNYLKSEIENGTITAFLAHKNFEDKAVRPMGRINAKRFDSDDNSEIQFVPEKQYYGIVHSTFRKAVSDFFEKNYPLGKKNYNKHPAVYTDDTTNLISKREDSKSSHADCLGRLKNIARRHLGVINSFNGNDSHYDKSNAVNLAVSNLQDNFNEMSRCNKTISAISTTIAHENDNKGGFPNPEDTDNHTVEQLIAHAYSTSGKFHDKIADASRMTDDEIEKGIDTLHHHFHEDSDTPASKEIYAAIHDNAIQRIENSLNGIGSNKKVGNDKILNKIANNIEEKPRVYHDIEIGQNTALFNKNHPAILSNNPRTIDRMIDFNENAAPHLRSLRSYNNMNEFKREELDMHIGRHADQELAQHFHENKVLDPSYNGFVDGLNKNKDGEHIEHSLIHGLGYGINAEKDKRLIDALAEHSNKHSVLMSISMNDKVSEGTRQLAKKSLLSLNTEHEGVTEFQTPKGITRQYEGIMKNKFDKIFNGIAKTVSYSTFLEFIINDEQERDCGCGECEHCKKQKGITDNDTPSDHNQETFNYLDESKKKKKKKPAPEQQKEEEPPASAILINPDKSEI